MKTLLLMRHATAGWANADITDHERPLNECGLAEAADMARVLTSGSAVPQRILASTASRAVQTAEVIAAAIATTIAEQPAIVTRRSLYLAEPDACIEQLRTLPDDVVTTLLVGHNPGLEALVHRLTGETVGFGTATLARVDLDCRSWKEIQDGCGDTTGVWRPGPHR